MAFIFSTKKPFLTYDSVSGPICTFTSNINLPLPLKKCILNIPVTQTGSGTPSPDNKRDFIGFGGVNIGQTSDYGEYFKGLLNGTYGFVDLGDLNWIKNWGQGTPTGVFFSEVLSSSKASCEGASTGGYIFYKGIGPNSMNNKGVTLFSNNRVYVKNTDYTEQTDLKTSLSGVYLIYELETPTTPVTPQDFATLCQAFGITGNIYQITFGQTVYSAILDVLTGKLSITHEIKTIDENSDIDMTSITSVFYWNDFFDTENDTESVDCNCYYKDTNRANPNSVSGSNHDLTFCCRTSAPTLYIKDTRFTSIEDYKTWLSTNPVKIAVKFAEPIEIQLTPTIINTLIGENVIFADVADTNVEYYKFG